MSRLLNYFRSILAAEAATAPRMRLPDRRESRIVEVHFVGLHGVHAPYAIGFSWDHARSVREAFYAGDGKSGSEMRDLIHDGCIAISRALQFGDDIGALAQSFGRTEIAGDPDAGWGPCSVLGAIALAGAALEHELAEERA